MIAMMVALLIIPLTTRARVCVESSSSKLSPQGQE
jgi:hypothetical protein